MAIGDDFTVNAAGDIRHVSGTDTFTVLQFHRWLQDLADQAQGSGNDLLDITSVTPSARATDNIITLNAPYNIDDGAAEFLYDGSIEQDGGDVMYSGLVVVGAVAGATTLQVVQDAALYDTDAPFWGTGINADAAANILCRMLIKTRDVAADIDGKRILVYAREWGHTFAEFSVTMGLGNSVAAIFTSTDLNNTTVVGTVATWTTISNTEGYQTIDLLNGDGAKAYFSQWNKAAYSINQLYERAKWLTRRGSAETLYGLDGELFRGITHEVLCDAPSATQFNEPEEITWSGGKGQLLASLDADSGAIQINVVATAGTFTRLSGSFLTDGFMPGMQVQFTNFTLGGNNVTKIISTVSQYVITVTNTSGLQDETGGGNERALTNILWFQLVSGVAPTNNQTITGTTSTATAVVNVSITSRNLSPVFLGQSTGSAVIGAFGIGVEAADLTQNDKLFDLTNILRTPPNNQKFYVYGLVQDEDRVLVTNAQTGNIDFDQLALGTDLIGGTETQVDVGIGNIPADTPQTGCLRIELDSGIYRRVPYLSHDSSRYFTIASTDFTDPNDAASTNNVFIAYIDKDAGAGTEEITLKYSGDRTMFVRVRDGGGVTKNNTPIKTFETTTLFTGGGGSATAIRTPDA